MPLAFKSYNTHQVRLMKSVPTIRVHLLRLFVETLMKRQIDHESFMRRYGLRPTDMHDAYRRMPLPQFILFQEEVAEILGDTTLGLRLGAEATDHTPSSFSLVINAASSLGDALVSFSSYARAMNEGWSMTLIAGENGTEFTYEYQGGDWSSSVQDVDYSIASLCGEMRRRMGTDWSPAEVHFRHAGQMRRQYEAVLGCPVYFEQRSNCIVVAHDDLKRQVGGANPAMRSFIDSHMRHLENEMLVDDIMSEKVRRIIAQKLGSQQISLARVAKELGLSARSLQRRLAEEGIGFRELINGQRRQIAESLLLRGGRGRITGIALTAGYSDAAVLSRAFRGWTGESPREFVKRQREEKDRRELQ